MKKTLLLFFFTFPFLLLGQIQLGSDIDGEAAYDQSGYSVSLSADGSKVAIGAYLNSFSFGHVRVYSWSGSSWVQLGNDIDGEAADLSGGNVSLSADGSKVAIGAIGNDENGSDSGHVRVYSWSGSSWVQLGNDIDGEAAGDKFGYSVSLSSDGSIVAIGANGNDGNSSNSGHVRIYSWSGSVWTQLGNDIDGESASDESGVSVSLSADGSKVAIGANGNGTYSGHARVYSWSGSSWVQLGNDIDGEAAYDQSGISVSLSADGSIVSIGAHGNDDNGSASGHVRVYDLSTVLASDSFVLSQFSLYPNPVKKEFTIQLKQDLVLQKVTIYNNLGQLLHTTTNNIVTTNNLVKGIYFIVIETNKGKATKKLIVE